VNPQGEDPFAAAAFTRAIEKKISTEITGSITYILVYSKDSELDGRTERVDKAREYEKDKGKELPKYSFPKVYSKHSPVGNLNIRLKEAFYRPVPADALTADSDKVTPVAEAATILNDTEEFYLEQISKAIQEDNLSRALSLVEEAERAGSTKAKSHYTAELEKQQQ
jgi:maltose operon protein